MNKVYKKCISCKEVNVVCDFEDQNPICIECFINESMTIHEAILKGIRRVYSPGWKEKNAYILLPEIDANGRYGIWCKLFSQETQLLIGSPCPQEFLIVSLINGTKSQCHKYTGPISEFDFASIEGGKAA